MIKRDGAYQGDIPFISVRGDGIAEAWEKATLALNEHGAWYERGGRKDQGRLQVDSSMAIEIARPFSYPMYHLRMTCGPADLVEYQFEILGAKNSWVDETGQSEKWIYQYPQRLEKGDQIEKMLRNLARKPNTRQVTAITWDREIDPKTNDPPCLQRVWFALVPDLSSDDKGMRLNMNYNFRSRNAMIASPMNQIALATFMRHFRDRLQGKVDFPVGLGRILDFDDSYHVSAQDQHILREFLDYMDKSTAKGETVKERSRTLDNTLELFISYIPEIEQKVIEQTRHQLEQRGVVGELFEEEAEKIRRISKEVARIDSTWVE